MNFRVIGFFASTFLLSVCALNVVESQITETKIVASDGNGNDGFGWSVSVYGDYALVGAWLDDDSGTDAGSAYIFHFDGSNWVEQAKLFAGDGAAGDLFGCSVSLFDDFALVGAYEDDDNGLDAGAAYIFRYDGTSWIELIKLVGSDVDAGDEFGSAVLLSGDRAFVGAYGWDGHSRGSVYIFHYDGSTWLEQTRLLASDGEPYDWFGCSISLSGRYALIGAYGEDENGSAYVFHYDGSYWVEEAKLISSDGAEGDSFGYSVSISGEYALVGAYEDDDNGSRSGSAYIFHNNGSSWVEQAKLTASDGDDDDLFGETVSLLGDYAFVGAWRDGVVSGSAYIFHHDESGWVEQTKFKASDFEAGGSFGRSLSLYGEYAFIGAPGGAHDRGCVYIYSATPLCSKVSQFQARCRPSGLIKARVTMADASHAGDIVEISIDDVPYEVTIDATGRGQLSQGGFSSGPHTVELTNPGQCFDPIVVTCRTGLDEEASADWDDELISEPPAETTLVGNYPNPFNPSTTIRYTLSNEGSVSVRVYNMLGQEVATLVDGVQKAGEQSVTWHGTNNFGQSVASGLYIYRLQAGNLTLSQKMLFAK